MEPASVEGHEQKARRYARLNYWFSLVNLIYPLALLAIFLVSGASYALASAAQDQLDTRLGAQAFYLVAFILFMTIAFWPPSFLRGYVIEHRFGLSNQNILGWLGDQLRALVLSLVVLTPAGLLVYFLLERAGPLWWLYAALLWTVFTFVLAY